ncbi:hypothetical protein EMCRGX_G009735 [Ephydatia muelleri]
MWVNEWAALGDHIKTCAYESVSCTECLQVVLRRSLSTHMLSVCAMRRYTCPHCKQEGIHEHIIGQHLVECTDVMIRCGCEVTVKRRDMESHSAKCPKVQIACPNTKVGCTIVCLREYMLHFEGVIQFHLDKAIMALQQPNGVVIRDANHVITIDEKQNWCKVLVNSSGPGIGYVTYAALNTDSSLLPGAGEDSVGLSFQLATLDYSGKLNLWVVVEIYRPDPHGSESDLRLVPGTQGKTGQELEVEC